MSDERYECPELLRLAFHELLYYTLIYIRSECTNSKLTFAHADHVHNIPRMLSEFKPELLAYYWEIERPCFLRQLPEGSHSPMAFDPLWVTIEREYQRLCKPETV